MGPDPKSREEYYKRAEAHLSSNEIEKAQADILTVELMDKIDAYHAARRRYSSLVWLCVLTLVTVAFSITAKLSSTNIELYIESEGLHLSGSAWTGNTIKSLRTSSTGLHLNKVDYFNNLPPISLRPTGLENDEELQGGIEITAKRIEIDDLSLKAAGGRPEISLELYRDTIDLSVKKASLIGRLTAHKPDSMTLLQADSEKSLLRDQQKFNRYDRHFRSSRHGTRVVPINLRLSGTTGFSMEIENLHALSFSKQDQPGSGVFVATTLIGKLQMLDTGKSIEIEKGQYLYLECNDCRRNLVRFEDNKFIVSLRGKVKRVAGGYADIATDYMPNLLDYLFYNERIAMLWTTVIFVSGMLLKFRKI